MDNEQIINARNEFFNKLRQKNEINHARIDELDIDNIGVVLNYQQIDLMNLAILNKKTSYKKYQDELLSLKEFSTNESEKLRHLAIIKEMSNDEFLPEKVRNTLIKIYDETKRNPAINDEVLMTTIYKLICKLSTDLQNFMFKQLNNIFKVEKVGIKKMNIEDALKLFSYIDKDYTLVTLDDVTSYKNYTNLNGSYNKSNFENMLDFCYENDKQVRINCLTSFDSFPSYLYKQPKDVVKQRLLTYVDDLTRYIKNYNVTHTRIDRKPFIRSIDVFSDLITNDIPFLWRGNINDKEVQGWQGILSLEDLCDVIKVARKNLPDVDFTYNEDKMEIKEKRDKVCEVLKAIHEYEHKNKVTLINTIGVKMHVNLDLLKDDIVNMFQDLNELKMPISITEFDLYAPYDMILNNNNLEIEILRDRFISDFCNVITSLITSKTIYFDSISIDSVNDYQNEMLLIVNNYNEKHNLPNLKTIYGGLYDNDMNRKEDIIKQKTEKFNIKKITNEKGIAESLYILLIIGGLLLVVGIVCYLFIKYM